MYFSFCPEPPIEPPILDHSIAMEKHDHMGFLSFAHLLIRADGVADRNELDSLSNIKAKENIPHFTFGSFDEIKKTHTEGEIYHYGLDQITKCSEDEKLGVLATFYGLSEVELPVQTEEITLLLYSVDAAGIEFIDDFVKANKIRY